MVVGNRQRTSCGKEWPYGLHVGITDADAGEGVKRDDAEAFMHDVAA
jgi:hypothetical protein